MMSERLMKNKREKLRFEKRNEFMTRISKQYNISLLSIFFFIYSMKSRIMRKKSMSK